VLAAAAAVAVAAAVCVFVGVVAFVVRASARAVGFSLRSRFASYIVDVLGPVSAEVSGAVDPASWLDFAAALDTSDLASHFRYSEPPDADMRADLSDVPGYSCDPQVSQLEWLPGPTPRRAR